MNRAVFSALAIDYAVPDPASAGGQIYDIRPICGAEQPRLVVCFRFLSAALNFSDGVGLSIIVE